MNSDKNQQKVPAYANDLQELTTLKSLIEYLEKLENQNTPKSFSEYFKNHEKVKEKGLSRIILESGLDRTYAYQIIQGRKKPGRDKALALCLAAGFSYEETQTALLCGNIGGLNARNAKDAILIYAANQKTDVFNIQELLYNYNHNEL